MTKKYRPKHHNGFNDIENQMNDMREQIKNLEFVNQQKLHAKNLFSVITDLRGQLQLNEWIGKRFIPNNLFDETIKALSLQQSILLRYIDPTTPQCVNKDSASKYDVKIDNNGNLI
jgi:hypothetical protein